MLSAFDRLLLPLRLARARARGRFVNAASVTATVPAIAVDLDFPEGEVAYNGMGIANDGSIVFAVSTKRLDAGARLFRLDSGAQRPVFIADLDRALSTPRHRSIPQGKVHVDFTPFADSLIAATHVGWYDPSSAIERPALASGYGPYPGGYVFRVAGSSVTAIAQAPQGEGVISLSIDAARSRGVALTWPSGKLLTVDLSTGLLHDHGPVFGKGEAGAKRDGTWERICRSIGVEPRTGRMFWSNARGEIVCFDGERQDVVARTPRHELWRKVVFHPARRVFYGITWDSGSLFEFDPAASRCTEIGRLRPRATLGLAIRGDTLHALVPGPGLLGSEMTHQLASTVSHAVVDLACGAIANRGTLRLGDGRFVTEAQSLVFAGGKAWTLAWVEVPSNDRTPRANQIRQLRLHSREYRSRGYAEEIVLVSFDAG